MADEPAPFEPPEPRNGVTRVAVEPPDILSQLFRLLAEAPLALIQLPLAFAPLAVLWVLRDWVRAPDQPVPRPWLKRLRVSVSLRLMADVIMFVVVALVAGACIAVVFGLVFLLGALGAAPDISKASPLAVAFVGNALGFLLISGAVLYTELRLVNALPAVAADLPGLRYGLRLRIGLEKSLFRFSRTVFGLIGTLFVIGFSLLPLSALLIALPAVSPTEAVLTDSVRPARSWLTRTVRRAFALFAGLVVLVTLLGFAVEVVSRLPLPAGGQMGTLAKKVLGFSAADFAPDDQQPAELPAGKVWATAPELLEKVRSLRQAANRPNLNPRDKTEAREKLTEAEAELEERTPKSAKLRLIQNERLAPVLAVPLWKLLPLTLVEQWPFVLLVVYGTDLLLLLLIGKVPLTYNFRYLWVRRRDTALTAVAFTVVVALVVVLLAFVNGMYKLNESTGVPGNVLVMSEGSTDELFSNLARGDGQNVERVSVTADERGRPIGGKQGVGVGRGTFGPDGKLNRLPPDAPKDAAGGVYLASYESYIVMNQAVPPKTAGETPKRRFIQMRAFQDVRIASAVHNIDLEPGGRWFAGAGVEPGERAPDGLEYLQCCVGEGSAATLGEDVGKPRLAPGDTFELGDRWWKVIGVMRTRGTTYGSELWTGIENPVVQKTGKGDKFTTLVLRMSDDTDASAKAMAYYLNEVYEQAKLKAFSEPDYYKELTKTNEQFLTAIVMMAVIMAVGGIFGVMNTMFASIAARMKEVGVLRILGFKRWQILISFMIESLAIAFVGGLLGCVLGLFANGFEAASTLSGGQGGGKSVTLTMQVDFTILATGMLFTLVMGRLGGLVPALSAMRMEILDSLR